MDWITDLPVYGTDEYGNPIDSLLVVCEKLSTYARLIPCSSRLTAEQLAKLFLSEVVRHEGWPARIISDRDKLIRSGFWQHLMKLGGCKLSMSTAFHPETDGQNERIHSVIEDMLRAYVSPDLSDWADHLPMVELALNTRYVERLECSPFFLVKGREARFPLQLSLAKVHPQRVVVVDGRNTAEAVHIQQLEQLQKAKALLRAANDRMKAREDGRRREHSFSAGQQVLLSAKHLHFAGPKCKKLQSRYIGPYKIVEMVGAVAARLDLPATLSRIHPVFHVSLLKPYHSDGREQPPEPTLVLEGEELVEEFEVERILDHRTVGRTHKRQEYLVRFVGYDRDHDEWLPEENLEHAAEVLQDYLTYVGQQSLNKRKRKRKN